jgi:hypothetical protein
MAEKLSVGQSYRGPSSALRDSQWLAAEDLPEGKDIVVKVKDVQRHRDVSFRSGRVKKVVGALIFEGKDKMLPLNSGNRKMMDQIFGTDTAAWIGQSITLYVTDVLLAGEPVKGIKIRQQRSRAAAAGEEFLAGAGEGDPKPSAPAATQSDADRWKAFRADCERATSSFGGERLFIKQAPPKSGQWYTCDAALADPPIKLFDENALALSISVDELAVLTEKLERAIA